VWIPGAFRPGNWTLEILEQIPEVEKDLIVDHAEKASFDAELAKVCCRKFYTEA